MTECELYYGAFKSGKKNNNLKVVEDLKKKVCTLHTVEGVSLHYGKIKSELERSGQALDDADILIASMTLANNATLVSNNIGHFKRIRGLKLQNWK